MPELDQTGALPLTAPGITDLPSLQAIPDPNASAPITEAPAINLVTVPMTEEQIQDWWGRIGRARQRRDFLAKTWDQLLKDYLPVVSPLGEPEAIKTNAHFRNVQTKIANLFYKTPELVLTAKGPLKDPIGLDPLQGPITAEDVPIIKQQVLSSFLGIDHVDASRLIDELLFDVLSWAGVGASKIGYRAISQPIQGPVPDPMTGQPALDPLTQQPQMRTINVPIFEEWYWHRFSPKKLLLPDDLRSSRYDEDASWIGMEFFMPRSTAIRAFNLTQDVPIGGADELVYRHTEDSAQDVRDLIHGLEIWYKASIFDDTQVHPQKIRHLVLIEGMKSAPAVHRDSPDQTFDARGKLTPDSLIGFPIHVLSIRDLADSPYPPADSAFSQSQVKHMNTHRQQSVLLRDAQIQKWLYDTGAFSPEEVDRLKNGPPGSFVGVESGKLAQGKETIITGVGGIEATRDDWRLAAVIKQDMEETLGLGGPQVGVAEDTVRTATESAITEGKANVRLEKEQARVVSFFLRGVRKFDALLQRYADEGDYVEIVGQNGMKRLMKWNKTVIAGRYAYNIKPDSQLRIDAARDRIQTLNFYNLAAQDPLVNRAALLRKLAQQFGIDPSEILMPPPPPLLGGPAPGMGGPMMGGPVQPPMGGGAVNQHIARQTGGRPNEKPSPPRPEPNEPPRMPGGMP